MSTSEQQEDTRQLPTVDGGPEEEEEEEEEAGGNRERSRSPRVPLSDAGRPCCHRRRDNESDCVAASNPARAATTPKVALTVGNRNDFKYNTLNATTTASDDDPRMESKRASNRNNMENHINASTTASAASCPRVENKFTFHGNNIINHINASTKASAAACPRVENIYTFHGNNIINYFNGIPAAKATVTKKSDTVTTVTSSSKEAKKEKAKKASPGGTVAGGTRADSRPKGTPASAEKGDLAQLNDRLASCVDTVRRLEAENSRLARLVETQEATARANEAGIRGWYENELGAARIRLLNEVAADRARLVAEVGGLKSELADTAERLRLKEAEADDVEGNLRSCEDLLRDMKPRLVDSEAQRARVKADFDNLIKEYNFLRTNHENLKRRLDEETSARVDLLNQCKSMHEELSFARQVHARDLDELMAQKRLEKLGRVSNVTDGPSATLPTMSAELEQSKSRLRQRDSEIASYEALVRDLEVQIGRERGAHQGEVESLRADLCRLRGLLDEQLHELNDLRDVKIRLNADISAYRKLLDNEDTRVGDQPSSYRKSPGKAKKRKLDEEESSNGSPSFPSSSSSGSTVVATAHEETRIGDQPSPCLNSPGKAKKRKLDEELFSGSPSFHSSFSKSTAVTRSHAEGAVTIDESSSDGSFVKLLNASDNKSVTLAGWQLKQTANGKETTYRFPMGYELNAKQHVTVWGKASGSQSSSSSDDLLMEDHDWVTGDEVLTELINEKGKKVASLETKLTSRACPGSVLADGPTPKRQKSLFSRWFPLGFLFEK